MNTTNPDPLFVHSRSFGGVETIELSTVPGDLGLPEELQRERPRRRRSDRMLARLPRIASRVLLVGCGLALVVWPFLGAFK